MTKQEKQTAFEMGQAARAAEKPMAPCQNKNIIDFIFQGGRKADAIALMKAFTKGWQAAHHEITNKILSEENFWK